MPAGRPRAGSISTRWVSTSPTRRCATGSFSCTTAWRAGRCPRTSPTSRRPPASTWSGRSPPRSSRRTPRRSVSKVACRCAASTGRSTRRRCATCSPSPRSMSPTGCPRTSSVTASTSRRRGSTCRASSSMRRSTPPRRRSPRRCQRAQALRPPITTARSPRGSSRRARPSASARRCSSRRMARHCRSRGPNWRRCVRRSCRIRRSNAASSARPTGRTTAIPRASSPAAAVCIACGFGPAPCSSSRASRSGRRTSRSR